MQRECQHLQWLDHYGSGTWRQAVTGDVQITGSSQHLDYPLSPPVQQDYGEFWSHPWTSFANLGSWLVERLGCTASTGPDGVQERCPWDNREIPHIMLFGWEMTVPLALRTQVVHHDRLTTCWKPPLDGDPPKGFPYWLAKWWTLSWNVCGCLYGYHESKRSLFVLLGSEGTPLTLPLFFFLLELLCFVIIIQQWQRTTFWYYILVLNELCVLMSL